MSTSRLIVEPPTPTHAHEFSRRALILGAPALAIAGLARPAHATVGARPPAFTLRSAPGAAWKGTFKLSDYLGKKPIFMHFFATWCNPCEIEMVTVEKLKADLEAKGLVILGISVDDSQSAPGVGPMARRLKVTYPIVIDTDSTVASRLNPKRTCPYSIYINRKGIIVKEREGWTAEHAKTLPTELEELVSK